MSSIGMRSKNASPKLQNSFFVPLLIYNGIMTEGIEGEIPKDDVAQPQSEDGELADKELVDELTELFSSRWEFRADPPVNPVVLLLGGFQGSGKTTTVDRLSSEVDLAVISPDAIRHELFARNIPFSETFRHTVNATRNNLIKRGMKTGHHIVVDQGLSLARRRIIEEIVAAEREEIPYAVKAVLLIAPEDVLRDRVATRQPLPGKYTGTVQELEASMSKYGPYDISIYDLVINTETYPPDKVAEQIKALLAGN